MNLILIGSLTVVLMVPVVQASDGCPEEDKPVYCYHCSTLEGQPNCGDPFNSTEDGIGTIWCDGSCVKLVRYDIGATKHVIRTCTTRMIIKMHIHQVCMKESFPKKGRLCFCKDDREKCNSSPRLAAPPALPFILACSVLHELLLGQSYRRTCVSGAVLMAFLHHLASDWRIFNISVSLMWVFRTCWTSILSLIPWTYVGT